MTRIFCKLLLALLACDQATSATPAVGVSEARNTLTRAGDARYRSSHHPDRIVLLPGADAAREVAINWRTEAGVKNTVLQWARAIDSPGLHLAASTTSGQSRLLNTRNGVARHHSVRLANLTPDTLYAYRVGGGDTWSEWLQFRTAASDFRPFSLLYFGDAQNSVRSHFSRVVREGFRVIPSASLILHAGDLVNQGDGNHDDEWGEWFEAGGFLNGMVATVPVAGNHEYVPRKTSAGKPTRGLAPHWSAQFTTPGNGPPGLKDTVYYVSHSGVLIVVLDSFRAIDDESSAMLQARWLEEVLSRANARWILVSHHHPIFSVAVGRDNQILRKHWLPMYEKYGVALVLQGHDHTYGRGTNVIEGATLSSGLSPPVYVVSVAGPKQYIAAESAREGMQRIGEDMQLFQVIDIKADTLSFESRTAAGRLYDAFDIEYRADGTKQVIPLLNDGSPETRCGNPSQPKPSRCWEGTELAR